MLQQMYAGEEALLVFARGVGPCLDAPVGIQGNLRLPFLSLPGTSRFRRSLGSV